MISTQCLLMQCEIYLYFPMPLHGVKSRHFTKPEGISCLSVFIVYPEKGTEKGTREEHLFDFFVKHIDNN